MATMYFSSFVLFSCIAANELIINLANVSGENKNGTYKSDYELISAVIYNSSDKINEYEKIDEHNLSVTTGVVDVLPSDVELKHPCQRPCEKGKLMTCKYNFVIEYYSVMGKGCVNCPLNKTHCSLKNCIPGDGIKRTVLVVNRQMPGPSIDVCYGDTIEVKVTNKLMDISTSIHWHGILQKETPYMDGVPFVSQCPIGPQSSFLYQFYADAPGTHIWHAHSAFQRGDGIYGALIIRVPPNQNQHLSLYDFELPQHVFTVMDWAHTFSADKFSLHIHGAKDNQPSTLLINGKGRFKKFQNNENFTYTPMEIFTVKQGYRYRFRLMNTGFLNCPIEMSIDKHNITVISSDGEDLQPVETISLVSLAGERFDFVVEANKKIDNYWIRFKGLLDCKFKEAYQTAVLHYEGADIDKEPDGIVTYKTANRSGLQVNKVNSRAGQENYLLISELSSMPQKDQDPALKPEPDFRFYIPFDFYPLDSDYEYGPYRFPGTQRPGTPQLNHISMEFPSFPIMTDLEKSKHLKFCNYSSVSMECRFKLCQCVHVLQVPLDSVVEIILIDEGLPYDANHPFHLHGFKFRVLGMDRLGNNTTEDLVRRLDKEGLLKRNFNNPPIKDTVTTPDGGYSILRFHAINPGYWMFHCHIDFHVEMGMVLLFKVGNESTFKLPPENFPKCGDYVPTPEILNENQAQFFPKVPITNGKEYYTVHTSHGYSKITNINAFWFSLCILLSLSLHYL